MIQQTDTSIAFQMEIFSDIWHKPEIGGMQHGIFEISLLSYIGENPPK